MSSKEPGDVTSISPLCISNLFFFFAFSFCFCWMRKGDRGKDERWGWERELQFRLYPSIPPSLHHFSKKSATISGVPTGLGPLPPKANISATTRGVKIFSVPMSLMLSITCVCLVSIIYIFTSFHLNVVERVCERGELLK